MNSTKKVLLAEDDPVISKILVNTLSEKGFTVIHAHDGEETIEMAKSESPDLILLDIIMPRKDGQEVLKELQESDWGKDIPVIVLTNLSFLEYEDEVIRNKVLDYLIKTKTSLDEIVTKVDQALQTES